MLPAVRSYRYSPPQGGDFLQFVTAGSISKVIKNTGSTDIRQYSYFEAVLHKFPFTESTIKLSWYVQKEK